MDVLVLTVGDDKVRRGEGSNCRKIRHRKINEDTQPQNKQETLLANNQRGLVYAMRLIENS